MSVRPQQPDLPDHHSMPVGNPSGNMPDRHQQTPPVKPVDPFEGGKLALIEVAPRARRWITSVLNRPIMVSAKALSCESPTLSTEGSIPASASHSILQIDKHRLLRLLWLLGGVSSVQRLREGVQHSRSVLSERALRQQIMAQASVSMAKAV